MCMLIVLNRDHRIEENDRKRLMKIKKRDFLVFFILKIKLNEPTHTSRPANSYHMQ